jgi:hypothetical protein
MPAHPRISNDNRLVSRPPQQQPVSFGDAEARGCLNCSPGRKGAPDVED